MKNRLSELKEDFFAKGGIKDTWLMVGALWGGAIILHGGYKVTSATIYGAFNGGLQGCRDGFITGCQEAANVIPEHIQSTWTVLREIPRNFITMPRDTVRLGMMAAQGVASAAQFSYQHIQTNRQRSALIAEIKSLPTHSCQEKGQRLFLLLTALETKPNFPNVIAGLIVTYAIAIPTNEKLLNMVVRNFSSKNTQFFLPPSTLIPLEEKKKDHIDNHIHNPAHS